jgi:hypothetical protein
MIMLIDPTDGRLGVIRECLQRFVTVRRKHAIADETNMKDLALLELVESKAAMGVTETRPPNLSNAMTSREIDTSQYIPDQDLFGFPESSTAFLNHELDLELFTAFMSHFGSE